MDDSDEGPIWMVIADAGRARILELAPRGQAPCLIEEVEDPHALVPPGRERTGDEMRRFAKQLVDWLEAALSQARFEFLRVAVAPRFSHFLRPEIDKHLDLHRAILEWQEIDLIDVADVDAVRRMRAAGRR
jgi:hypothetical protein